MTASLRPTENRTPTGTRPSHPERRLRLILAPVAFAASMPETFKAPRGTHDVLPPESLRWEALVARFATLLDRAGYGLLQPPMFEDVGVFAPGRRVAPTSSARRCTSSTTGAAATWPCGPRAPPRWCGPSSSTARRRRGRSGTSAPNFRYERPQAGRYRQHHQVGVEVLGTDDPDVDVEVIALAVGLLRVARPAPADPAAELARRRRVPARLPRARSPATSRSTRRRCATSTGERWSSNPLRVLDCKRRRAGRRLADAPRWSTTCATPCRRTSSGCSGGLGAARHPLRARAPAGARASTTTPAPPSSSRPARSTSPRTRSAGAVATTGWSSRWAARPRRASASARGIERILLACDAEGVFPGPPRRRRRVRGRRHRRRRRARASRPSCGAAGLERRPRLRRPVDEGPDEGGRPLRRPPRPDRRRAGAGRRHGHGARPAATAHGQQESWPAARRRRASVEGARYR